MAKCTASASVPCLQLSSKIEQELYNFGDTVKVLYMLRMCIEPTEVF